MKNNSIVCPACKTEIELTEVVTHQVRKEMAGEVEARRQQLEAEFAQRDQKLNLQAAQMEKDRRDLDARVQEKLQLERARILSESRKQAENDLALQMKDLQEQLQSKETKLAEAQKTQIESLKKERALADREKELELELNRKLNAGREKLQQQAREFALAEHNLKLADKEKQIEEMRQQIEALNHRAHKGSQQLQGEVLEVQFETMLRQNFPHDEIEGIKSGANGADILHTVRTTQGVECGRILWEVKRTANYSKGWIPKLKEDQRNSGAELAVILTQALPDDIEHFAHRDGVWVTGYACGMGLAAALRQGLLQMASARRAAQGKSEKMEAVYEYLCGTEFRHKIEALVEGFIHLRGDLEAEKRATQRQWAKREKHLEQLVLHTASLYGGLQGIIGATALPEIQSLSLNGEEQLLEE